MAQTASVLPAIAHLNKRRIVLASGSPRRKEILGNLGLNFEVIASTFPENLDKLSMNADTYVLETAIAKGCEVHQRTQSAVNGQMTISADTVIAHKSRILEKPRNREHAVEILRALSGGVHQVLTAVVVVYGLDPADQRTPLYATSVQTTEVEFAELSEEMIEAYVATGEPM
ncbi:hypothetical protein PhCBS80983_g04727 [Powellomyces hirtus]|uniref:Septum formation protein Maf n=1 Tax=Powellomyces hirtus TaxID=109895 RepID=A0A507DWR2_9FUNG|nr:hypothetical protein PhCBS80983_g04727 [Powellomyces hirtus]